MMQPIKNVTTSKSAASIMLEMYTVMFFSRSSSNQISFAAGGAPSSNDTNGPRGHKEHPIGVNQQGD
jgi:hypothetical protein